MLHSFAPIFATLVLICVGTAVGAYPIKKLIQIKEAKHELKHGSPGFFRTMKGWVVIAIWAFAIWFFATITGDWWVTGDLDGAIARSGRRLEILLNILSALSDD